MNKIKLGISGISGKMGQNVLEIVSKGDAFEIVAGFHNSDADFHGVKCYSDVKDFLSNIDVCIDFSSKDNLIKLLHEAILFNRVAIVSGTTGLSEQDHTELKNYGKVAKIFWASNFSIGVSIFKNILGKLLPIINNYDFDIELLEKHHKFKKDAPSGTAVSLLKQIAAFKNKPLEEVVHYNSVATPMRENGKVGVAFQRGGGVIGEHELSFFGTFEELSIKHTAYDRKVFANGAITAAKWLLQQNNGYFSMEDII